MNWKYFIPHVWEEEETSWEDIYLRKIDKPEEKMLFLSINSRLFWDNPSRNDEKEEWRKGIIAHLETHEYLIEEPEMYVSLDAFNLEQFLHFTKMFLEEKGYRDNNLIEGTYEEFIEEIEEYFKSLSID